MADIQHQLAERAQPRSKVGKSAEPDPSSEPVGADRYMMATQAVHKLGDISRDEPSLAIIYGEDGDDLIGEWVTGVGYVNVRFPKATTRELTAEERSEYNGKLIDTAGAVQPIVISEPEMHALFDVSSPVTEARPKPAREARRRQRQTEAMQHGQHPLAVALRIPIRIHPDAPTNPLDRTTPGLRCGTCAHRELHNGGTAQDFPKCFLPGPGASHPRITGGPGTDVRAWWPACPAHQPKETS